MGLPKVLWRYIVRYENFSRDTRDESLRDWERPPRYLRGEVGSKTLFGPWTVVYQFLKGLVIQFLRVWSFTESLSPALMRRTMRTGPRLLEHRFGGGPLGVRVIDSGTELRDVVGSQGCPSRKGTGEGVPKPLISEDGR